MSGADTVYSMFGEGFQFLQGAKACGLRVVVDIFIDPMAHRVVQDEVAKFPGWEAADTVPASAIEARVHEILSVADLLLCPSQAVVEGLRHYACFCDSRAKVVPYGCPSLFFALRNAPTERRILFGGAATLRKGIHYMAQAARSLHACDHRYEFRVAGAARREIAERPECGALHFLGHLTRPEYHAELESADVLALPTLAEGSAGVIYEALAAGIPVVTTPSAGSVITDGVEGFIVPERDAGALADRVEEICSNRALRARMALAARKTAFDYSEERWADRLVAALTGP
jgi:glycosyltransferase involved in cell wall biosynthesis